MTQYSFLSKSLQLRFVISLGILWFFGPLSWFFYLLIIFAIFFFLYRRTDPELIEYDQKQNPLWAPVTGKVLKIKKNIEGKSIDVTFGISSLQPWGLYFPIEGEVGFISDMTKETEKFELNVMTNSYAEVKLKIKRNFYKQLPKTWVISGDRGLAAACFGYLAGGGKVKLSLPADVEILVVEGEDIVAGLTAIGTMKDSLKVSEDDNR